MKNGAAVLILIATVSCTTGGSAGSGGNPPPSIAFALPPQWTETFTREPTLPEPTVSSAREQTLPGQPAETEPTGDLDGAAVFEKVVTLDADGEPVVGIDYSPKWGLLVSISDRGVVRLWDTDDGTLLVLRETDSRGWASILLDPDADFFVLGLDEMIEIRSAETAEIIRAYTDNLIHHLLGMAFFPDRQLMAVTGEYGLQLFAGVSKDPAVRPKRLDTYFEAKAATRPVFNPEGTKLGYGGTFNGQSVLHISNVDYCADGFCFNGGEGGTLYGRYGSIVDLQFSAAGWLAVAGETAVAVYDESRREIAKAEVPNLAGISLVGDDTLLVCSTSDGRLILLRFPELERLGEAEAHQGPIRQLVYHAGRDKFATAGEDGKVVLWKIAVA
jgi:WD40 repeat protein